MITYSKHGTVRAQQRGIPPIIVDWLIKYGQVSRRHGADVYYFDKHSRKELKSDLGLIYRRIESFINVYVVISDDDVIVTTAKKTKRFIN